LPHGPYRAPSLRVGERVTCLFKDGDVVVTGWTDARTRAASVPFRLTPVTMQRWS
jgi:hypothetical protein